MAQKVCAAVYCRLAHEDSIAMECQKNFLRRWAMDNGYDVVDEITEVGSGIRLDQSDADHPGKEGGNLNSEESGSAGKEIFGRLSDFEGTQRKGCRFDLH